MEAPIAFAAATPPLCGGSLGDGLRNEMAGEAAGFEIQDVQRASRRADGGTRDGGAS